MKDFLDKVANNDQILIGLVIILIALIIAFFIVLLFSGKGKKKQQTVVVPEENTNNMQNPNVNFDQNEYVKETTAEFELAPIGDIAPVNDEFVPEVTEETPAHHVDTIDQLERKDVPTFSFDELSKMISSELDNYEPDPSIENTQVVDIVKEDTNPIPEVTFVDSFKEEKPVEPVMEPVKPEVNDNFSSVYVNNAVKPQTNNDQIVLPKRISQSDLMKALDKTTSNISDFEKKTETPSPKPLDIPEFVPVEPVQPVTNNFSQNFNEVKTASEPIIKDEDQPLFARFNQETYDINTKD